MTNIYIFWKESGDPPAPWTRLTRSSRYIRFASSTGDHWTDIGSATHTHSIGSFTCSTAISSCYMLFGSYGTSTMAYHTHAQGTTNVVSANNLPPGYALDIIYMDMDQWKVTCKFPSGSVVMSNGTLVDAELARFTAADGKYIYNDAPGSTKGTATHTHTVSGTTSSTTPSNVSGNAGGLMGDKNQTHSHTFSITSSSGTTLPASLTTRLYYALQETSKALAGIVVFVDGSTDANWSILTGWAGTNLVSGDSNPTLAGSDSHTQTFSGYTSHFNPNGADQGEDDNAIDDHYHPISGSLSSSSHVPQSKYMVPAVLLNTLYSRSSGQVRVIGMMM